VNAENAFIRNISPLLFRQESLNPMLPDIFEIPDFGHSVAGAISKVHALQPFAREFHALIAPGAGPFIAVPQPAVHTGAGLILLCIVTAVARVPLPQMSFADSAVHSARGNEICANLLGDFPALPGASGVCHVLPAFSGFEILVRYASNPLESGSKLPQSKVPSAPGNTIINFRQQIRVQ
jgi:hypothetical protein